MKIDIKSFIPQVLPRTFIIGFFVITQIAFVSSQEEYIVNTDLLKQQMLLELDSLKSRIVRLSGDSLDLDEFLQFNEEERIEIEAWVKRELDDLNESSFWELMTRNLINQHQSLSICDSVRTGRRQEVTEESIRENIMDFYLGYKILSQPENAKLLKLYIYQKLEKISPEELDENFFYDPAFEIVYLLTPNFSDIYPHGRSEKYDKYVESLSKEDYFLLCDILGFFLKYANLFHKFYSSHEINDEEVNIDEINLLIAQYSAAKAIKWGWNKHQNIPYQMVMLYYEKMFNYNWEFEKLDEEARRVCIDIINSFSDTPKPSSAVDIVGYPGMDFEIAECGLVFEGHDWLNLHPAFLMSNESCLSFFKPEALRYYIPAFMISDLFGLSSVNQAYYTLTGIALHGKDMYYMDQFLVNGREYLDSLIRNGIFREYNIERLMQFTPKERQGIISYLQYKGGQSTYEPDRKDAINAIKKFWIID